MAEKGGYPPGSYNQPPPPAYSYQAPPPYGASAPPQAGYPPTGTTVVIQQNVPPPKPKTNHGILGFLSKEVDAMGRMAQREIDWAANKVVNTVDQHAVSPILDYFKTNNIVQFVSRASGRTLQIVMSPTGQLVVDGAGQEGSQVGNAVWTVVNEGNNQVRLHNNYNYLAIVNGNTMIVNMPPGAKHGVETLLQLCQPNRNHPFLVLESKKSPGHCVGVLPGGQLKAALATGKGEHGQFGVRLIYSPYPPPPAGATKKY